MISSYFKFAIRSFLRNKSYSFINIVGLTVGISSFLLIFLVIQYELSFDDFHKSKERIYRLVSVPYKAGTGFNSTGAVPFPVAEGLRQDYPQLEAVARIWASDGQITLEDPALKDEKQFKEVGTLFYAETSFFDIFNFEWLSGSAKESLRDPNSVVLTRETAEKYFGNWQSAIGKSIRFRDNDNFMVRGILKDPPSNSDFPLKIVASFNSIHRVDLKDWVSTYGRAYTFVRLQASLNPAQFNAQLRDFVKKHKPADHANDGIILQPLSDMHKNGQFDNYNGGTFSKELINTLLIIAIFLLIIASVNFINLSTAQAVNRSREIGVRKVLGSKRSQLIWQHMSETFLFTIMAMILAYFIAGAILPFLNRLLDTQIRIQLNREYLAYILLVLLIGVTFLSGFYPAIVLSSFNPLQTLKDQVQTRFAGGLSIRKSLVVLQFCIAQTLIICVLVVASQMNYFRHASLGFDKESILNIPIPDDSLSQTRMESVRNQLLSLPSVKAVNFSTFSPIDNDYWSNYFNFDHSAKRTDFQALFKWADASFFKTYNAEIMAGKPYAPSDTLNAFVVNETLVKNLGIRNPNDILGKEISFWGGDKKAPVVAVVKDFHTNSLQGPIAPIVIGSWKGAYGMAGIKLNSAMYSQALPAIEKIWKSAYPKYVYSYQFLDDKINSYYKNENRLSQLYKIFAGIAIFISCLGLFGLVSFMAVQREKEVGVRKVLGASVANILYLFTREFIVLIAIAFLLAAPFAYYFMHKWLNGFTYRIEIGPGIFLITMLGSMGIAWLTVAFKALKASIANPIISLRNE